MQVQTLGYAISGSFTLLAVILSGWQIWTHLIYNPDPNIRKFIIRILLMVPLYGLTSWMALIFNKKELFFETLRDCYEAFVLYSFYCFLVEYLGGRSILANTLRSKSQIVHTIPCCCLKSWTMGGKFLRYSSLGILQYIPIKVFMSMVTWISSSMDIYGEGQFFNPWVVYPYVVFILNLSQGWALYCLVLFFLGTKEELAPVKPLPKFLAIKAIIFFTYWQSIIISLLQLFGVISEDWKIGCTPDCWDSSKIAAALNNFIICIEMLMFAIAHHYVFSIEDFLNDGSSKDNQVSSREYEQISMYSDDENRDRPQLKPIHSNKNKTPLLANLMDAINVTDVSRDMKNARQEILTKKQALAAKFDILSTTPPTGQLHST